MPVILMSPVVLGVRREDDRWQAFLSKPFSLDALLNAVNLLLGQPGPTPAV